MTDTYGVICPKCGEDVVRVNVTADSMQKKYRYIEIVALLCLSCDWITCYNWARTSVIDTQF